MPGFDGTGPLGVGPMTGGARGFCNPAAAGIRSTFYGRAGVRRGLGLGRGFRGGMGRGLRTGFGRGFGWIPNPYAPPYPSAMDAASELDLLKAQASFLKNTLDAISKRMAELEKSSD